MKYLNIVFFLLGILPFGTSQSDVKLKLKNNETIKGEWLGMEDDHYKVGMDQQGILFIPIEMVYKLQVKRVPENFPRYDNNLNALFYGVSSDFTTTIGQTGQDFKGIGIKGSVGYDWNHKYALKASVGYRNMNIGNPETFIPVSITPIKYLTQGRFLLYGGVEAGYNWGIRNPWQSGSFRRNPWASWPTWQHSIHEKGQGPSITPLLGVRMIGKYGIDHELSLGLHLQKFESDNKFEDDNYSKVEMMYRRWQVSYGLVF